VVAAPACTRDNDFSSFLSDLGDLGHFLKFSIFRPHAGQWRSTTWLLHLHALEITIFHHF
jgi:hypothetical protein